LKPPSYVQIYPLIDVAEIAAACALPLCYVAACLAASKWVFWPIVTSDSGLS